MIVVDYYWSGEEADKCHDQDTLNWSMSRAYQWLESDGWKMIMKDIFAKPEGFARVREQ